MMSMNTMPLAPSRATAGEEEALEQAGHGGGEDDAHQQGAAAVLLLQRRTHHQQQEHVAQEVVPARMAQHMAQQAHKEEGGDGRAVDREEIGAWSTRRSGGPAPGPPGRERRT